MILRKPYAFFIKYFKLFHIVITLLSGLLILKTIKMVTFFSDYSRNNELMVNGYSASDYINIYIFLLVFVIAAINVILLSVMIVKKKPKVQYIYNILTYVSTMVIFMFAYTLFREVAINIVDIRISKLIRDFLLISLLLQAGAFVITLVRSTGFDIKKFDFGTDLEKLNIDVRDNEEFEVDVEFQGNEFQRKIKRNLRHAKYAIVENKFFIIVASIIMVLFMLLMIYFNIGIYSQYVKENEYFSASRLVLNVQNSYITTKSYNGASVKNDKALVVVQLKMKTNNSSEKTFNTGLATLKIKDYIFKQTTDYITEISDLGKVYTNQTLNAEDQTYLLVYEIPTNLKNEKMEFTFNDSVSYVKGETGAKNIYVKLTPENLDENKNHEDTKLGEELKLSDSILANSVVKIDSYKLADSFKLSYKYCYSTDKCINSLEYINPTASSNYSKIIMKLEGSFTKDSSLNMSNMSNLYNFISMFGTLTYEIDGKTYAHPTTLRRVEAQKAKQDNIYYIEVVPDVSKATSIYFNFNVRGENYKYILK